MPLEKLNRLLCDRLDAVRILLWIVAAALLVRDEGFAETLPIRPFRHALRRPITLREVPLAEERRDVASLLQFFRDGLFGQGQEFLPGRLPQPRKGKFRARDE